MAAPRCPSAKSSISTRPNIVLLLLSVSVAVYRYTWAHCIVCTTHTTLLFETCRTYMAYIDTWQTHYLGPKHSVHLAIDIAQCHAHLLPKKTYTFCHCYCGAHISNIRCISAAILAHILNINTPLPPLPVVLCSIGISIMSDVYRIAMQNTCTSFRMILHSWCP